MQFEIKLSQRLQIIQIIIRASQTGSFNVVKENIKSYTNKKNIDIKFIIRY